MGGFLGIRLFGDSKRDRMVAEIRKRQEDAARKAGLAEARAADARAAGSRGRAAASETAAGTAPRADREASRPRGDASPPPSFTESRPGTPTDGFHPLGIFPIEDLLPLHRLFGSRSPAPAPEAPLQKPVRRASTVRFEEPARSPSPEPFPTFHPTAPPGGETLRRHTRPDPAEPVKSKRWRSQSSDATASPAREAAAEATRRTGRTGRTLSVPEPSGGWKLDPAPPRSVRELPPAALARYETFRGFLAQGHHPKRAAEMLGDTKYTQVKGAAAGDRFEIRLNGGHRVFFEVDKQSKSVRILEVGGHL